MKYHIENICNKFDKKKRLKYIFFWGHTEKSGMVTKACFSQWYPCKFHIDGITYFTTEQFMMAQKAILFNDIEIYNKILIAKHPKQYKDLGRKVTNFSESKWDKDKYDIVLKGNIAKFSQNVKLKEFLLNTNNRILVETSPYDRVWGIGKTADAENIENPYTWNGENLLGFALMEAREFIKENEHNL